MNRCDVVLTMFVGRCRRSIVDKIMVDKFDSRGVAKAIGFTAGRGLAPVPIARIFGVAIPSLRRRPQHMQTTQALHESSSDASPVYRIFYASIVLLSKVTSEVVCNSGASQIDSEHSLRAFSAPI